MFDRGAPDVFARTRMRFPRMVTSTVNPPSASRMAVMVRYLFHPRPFDFATDTRIRTFWPSAMATAEPDRVTMEVERLWRDKVSVGSIA